MTSADHPDALPEGYRVQEFEFLSVLGVGGFGTTYLAKNSLLDCIVAIKEYFPRGFASRMEGHNICPRSSSKSENYAWGLERFLDEAKTLAQLNHPGIIRIHKYFEAHGSGYIVMEYIEGETLSERLKRDNTLSESRLMNILNPLVKGLEQIHAAGYLHRDITPKNILLRKDGTPVLIDFGAARQAVGARSRSVTAVVTPGYAPLEQYSTRGRQQGPWTDIYGLSAVAYRCITGTVPKDATERAQDEVLTPASELAKGQYAKGLLTAVDRGLAVKVEDRPKSLKAWCSLWMQKEEQQAMTTEAKKQEAEQGEVKNAAKKETSRTYSRAKRAVWKNKKKKALISFVVGAGPFHVISVVLLVIGLYAFQAGRTFSVGILVLLIIGLYALNIEAIMKKGSELSRRPAKDDGVPHGTMRKRLNVIRVAAEQGKAKAQFNLGWMYGSGEGVPQDYTEAVKWYRLAAEQGNAIAQYNLGVVYHKGKGVAQDYIEAHKWYRLAAEQGDASALYNLGWMYDNGEVVSQDDAEAVKWYRLAAEQGNAIAQYILGWMYDIGEGVPQDDTEAVKWYRMAAEQGNAIAQNNLGVRYDIGEGVPQDDTEAVKWYRLAAEQGNASAQNILGMKYENGKGKYENGKGVAQDYIEAHKWYRLAAEQGNARAQRNLGLIYANGRGVDQDYIEAHKWFNLAASRFSSDDTDQSDGARKYRGMVEGKMTQEAITTAQRLAREWQPKTWDQLKAD